MANQMKVLRRWIGVVCLLALAGCALLPAPGAAQPQADVVVLVPAGIEADALRAASAAYQQERGLLVQVNVVASGEYDNALQVRLLAGLADVDLVLLPVSRLARWAAYGALLPLEDTAWARSSALRPWLASVALDGKVYGYPTQAAVEGVWYRADWLSEAGLPPPASWDALHSAALALRRMPDRDGLALAAAENDEGLAFGGLLAGFGGEILRSGNPVSPALRMGLDDPQSQRALAYYAALNADASTASSPPVRTRAAVLSALQSGQAAMGLLPLTAASSLMDCAASPAVCRNDPAGQPVSQMAFSLLPGLPSGEVLGEVSLWALPLHAAHAQAAQDFGAWLVGPVGARVWAEEGGIPASRDLSRADAALAAQSPYLAAINDVTHCRPLFPPVRSAEPVEAAVRAGVQAVVTQQLSVPAALAEMRVQIKRALLQGGDALE